jgi:hypothetical protein
MRRRERNHPQLIRELRLLERRTHRSGKDVVDHGRNGHDDHANALAGALHLAANKSKYRYDASMKWVGGPREVNAQWRAMRLQRFTNSGGVLR